MSADDDVRVGLLGVGAIAQIVHLPLLSQMQGVRLVAVCDQEQGKAEAIAGRFGVPAIHRRDDDVLRSDEVDAIIIATPNHLHEAQAIAALEAGKHVLVEKPLALDPVGVERVLDAAERADRVVMVALNNRYRPDAAAIQPFARSGELGDVFFVKGGWLNRRVRVQRPTWRHRRATAGGGALMDLGVQILDLCMWMLDYPPVERVVAHLHHEDGAEVEDAATMLVRTRPGPVVSVEVTWSLLSKSDRHFLRIFGTQGTASISPLSVFKEVEHGLLDVTPQLPTGRENTYTLSYRHELERFVAAVRGQAEAELPREQVELMRLIGLAYRSAAEGREVEA